jgi:hypothetical protein
MTDKKFTDEEIAEALGYCANRKDCDDGCPCVVSEKPCVLNNPNALFDLINRQRAEVESLKIANEKMYDACKKQEAEIESLQKDGETVAIALINTRAEVERLNKLVIEKHKEINRLDEYIQYTKAEAVKEFAERLENDSCKIIECNGITERVVCYQISHEGVDKIVKELTNENRSGN